MFKVSLSPKFWATAQAELQGENGSRVQAKIECQFKRLDQDEVKAFAERTSDHMKSSGVGSEMATTSLLEIMTDWKGPVDDDNQPIPFNADNLARVINMGMGGAMFTAFYEAQPKVRAKN